MAINPKITTAQQVISKGAPETQHRAKTRNVPTQIGLPYDLLETVDAICDELRYSRSAWIQKVIRDAVG